MPRVASRFLVVVMATLLATGWTSLRPAEVQAVSPNIVISQVYGGGGNVGATYTNDFIELYNRGASSVDVSTWSVQYASSAGTTWAKTPLSGSIAPGQYYLVQEAAGTGGTTPLPTPDATGSIAMSGTTGKVALVTNQTTIGAVSCPTVHDFVGYGTAANCFETAPTATLSNTTAAIRAAGGATDTDNNSADFANAAPSPRNSGGRSLTINDVSGNESNSGSAGLMFTVSLSAPAGPGGVTFDWATADGTATVADSDYSATTFIGDEILAGNSSTTFSIPVTGDTTPEADETFLVNITNVTGATIADGQGVGTILNDDGAPNPCTQTFTPIYSLQGSGSSAAITGNITTQGVVVTDIEGAAAGSGFYMQDLTGDGNAATSDGIFVFTGAADLVNVGEVVRVSGFARERFTQTTINGTNSNTSAVTNIVDCGIGSVPATDVTMPFASGTFLEQYEGMLVRFPQKLVISEYFNYGRFGEMVLALPLAGEPRPFSGTALDEPGAAANARTAANLLRRITLDDNQSAQNPPILRHPNGAAFTLRNKFRGGDKVENAVGALGYDFNLYRIFPTGPADYTADNTRPLAPEPVGGSLRVAVMNTLNFFLTIDTTDSDNVPGPCGGGANLDCRGADDDVPNDPTVDDEFTRQRAKLLEALVGLDADVLGLNELENTPGVDPLGDPTRGIVADLNDILGAGTYASIDTGTIGTDAIKVGLIYKPGVVTPVGSFEILDSTDDPRFVDTRSRPALAHTFEEIATGARFTVVVNHLKSKGSACGAGDPDARDGQGNCNGTRTLAAQALVDWVATDPTGSGDPDFLIMGDLNSYAMEDPIDAIKAGADDTAGTDDDWTNLIADYLGPYAYSYVFDGQNGYLDHALGNATIAGQVTGAADWHINADEPNVLDYDVTFKPAGQELLYEENQYRTSDHDPVVIGLNLVNDAPTIEVTAGNSCSATGNGGSFSVTVDDNERDAEDLTLSLEDNTNPTLIPSIAFSGSGANRTVTITAANKMIGTAVLTVGVNDGWNTTTTTINVQVGSGADDTFVGTADADLLIGGPGSDNLSGLGGADVLCGGQGSDTASGGDGNDAVEGDKGSDILSGGEGNDVLRGGAGNDSLSGEGGDDTLTGNGGADAFSGGAGADTDTDFTPADGDTSDGT